MTMPQYSSDPVRTGPPVPDAEPSTKDKAAQSAEAGKQAAGEVAQGAADKAKDVAAETKLQARDLLGQARTQLQDQASSQHRDLAHNVRAAGDELAAMAASVDQPGPVTDLVDNAGRRAHSLATWLDEREPGDLVEELRRFARRRPGAFLLGALAAGVIAGRLTRGVVAVHSDDASSEATQAPAPAAAPAPATQTMTPTPERHLPPAPVQAPPVAPVQAPPAAMPTAQTWPTASGERS
jgi:hypothetical protein